MSIIIISFDAVRAAFFSFYFQSSTYLLAFTLFSEAVLLILPTPPPFYVVIIEK